MSSSHHPYLHHAIFAGRVVVGYAFEFKETASYLADYLLEENLTVPNRYDYIYVGESEYADWKALGNISRNAYAEYSLLSCRTSERLMSYNCVVFHAVALRWRDHAWLISAPPGIGKSTQYKNLKELHPNEIDIICGDRPILEMCEDGSVFVHPSPWNGKERWHGADGAPLAGIIYLKHGENKIESITPTQAAGRTYFSCFQLFETTETLHRVEKLTNHLLKAASLWELTNRGDHASSGLIYNVMKQWEEQHHEI